MALEIRFRLEQLLRLLVPSCALTGLLLAQPSLRITTPTDGTTAHPGELLTVQVEASPAEAFKLVFVVGFEPIGFGREQLDKPPYRFTVKIPIGIRPDKYPITACGFAFSEGQLVNSDPIDILVERADSPISITVYPVVADFSMEQKRYLQVTGVYADKTTADLTQSSRIKYVSSAPSVATVSPQGIVTPVAPGTGKITVTYGNLTQDVPVKVSRSER